MIVPIGGSDDMEAKPTADGGQNPNQYSYRKAIIIGFLAAILIVGCLLTYKEASISDWVIAFFTAIMAFTTFLQWDAMREQNAHFVAQNKHMAEQNAVMIAQNEAIKSQIDQATEERRPWLTTTLVRTEFHPPKADVPLVFSIELLNTGRTPAILKSAWALSWTLGKHDEPSNIVAMAWSRARRSEIEAVVGATEGTFAYVPTEFATLNAMQVKGIVDGDLILYFVGAFEYTGPDGGDFAFECCYFLDRSTGFCAPYKKHNRIHVVLADRGA